MKGSNFQSRPAARVAQPPRASLRPRERERHEKLFEMRDANGDDEENGSLSPLPPAANENRSANIDSGSTRGACTRVNKQWDLRRSARENRGRVNAECDFIVHAVKLSR